MMTDVPLGLTIWTAATARVEAAGAIPHGGPAIAIFVAGLFVAVIGAVVAMETQRKPVVWAAVGFVVTLLVASGVLALL